MEELSEKIERFLTLDYGYGSGDGYGSGSGSGYGYGSGSGDGYGYGSGYGDGYGSGSGYGYGSGSGSGSGYGYGSGSGDGSGYGDGDGSGITSYSCHTVYLIDSVPTIIYRVHGNIAHGAIINGDLTFSDCVIVRDDRHFAHGKTRDEAINALIEKQFDDMDEDERIDAFLEAFSNPDEIVPNSELYDWHHRLTGSCAMGRDAFVKAHGIDMGGKTSVREFCRIVKDSYGGSIIRAVMERIGEA